MSKSAAWVAALLLSLSASGAHAAVTSLQAGMLASGTAPFDGAAGPGNDTSGSDAIIRTHDLARYTVMYGLDQQDTGVRLTLSMGATTLPLTYVGPANPQIAYFAVADLPTGGAGCQNIQATALTAADLTAGTKSGVTADGQTLVCVQPSPIAFGRDLNFRMRISGSAPNGATVAPPTVTLQSTNNAATSTVAALNDGSTTYGLPTLSVSAAPRCLSARCKVCSASSRRPACISSAITRAGRISTRPSIA